jgi:hypothetical protein
MAETVLAPICRPNAAATDVGATRIPPPAALTTARELVGGWANVIPAVTAKCNSALMLPGTPRTISSQDL